MMVVAGNFFLKKYISNCVILRAYDAHTREKKFFFTAGVQHHETCYIFVL